MTPLTAALLSDIDRIVASQGPDDDNNKTFWHNLGKVHRDKIARYGFETLSVTSTLIARRNAASCTGALPQTN